MNTIELEAKKAVLAREILCMDDETMINNIRLCFFMIPINWVELGLKLLKICNTKRPSRHGKKFQ